MHRRAFLASLAVAITIAASAAAPVQAASLVLTDTGQVGSFSIEKTATNSYKLTIPNTGGLGATLTNIGTNSLTPSTPVDFTVITFSATLAGDILTLSGATGVVKTIHSNGGASGDAKITFNLSGGQITIADHLQLFGKITDVDDSNYIATINGTAYDFKGLENGTHSFDFTDSGPNSLGWTNFFTSADVGTTIVGSGDFRGTAAIPEPTSVALMGVGLASLIAFRRRFAGRFRTA